MLSGWKDNGGHSNSTFYVQKTRDQVQDGAKTILKRLYDLELSQF